MPCRASNPHPNPHPQNAPPAGTVAQTGPALDPAQQRLRDQLCEFRTLVLRAAKRLDLPVTAPLIQNFMYKCASEVGTCLACMPALRLPGQLCEFCALVLGAAKQLT